MVLRYILAAVIAYLLGSISTGTLVAKFAGGPDLHQVGSKSTGATNVLRTMGLKSGLITFWGDALKAVAACLIGGLITGNLYGRLLAGLLVIIGHCWPVFFGFKGGKGVASTCGVMLVCFWWQAIICYVLTIATIAATKFVSVGSMLMVVLFGLLVSFTAANGDLLIIIWLIALMAIVVYRHRANIDRLMHGKENKLSMKKKDK